MTLFFSFIHITPTLNNNDFVQVLYYKVVWTVDILEWGNKFADIGVGSFPLQEQNYGDTHVQVEFGWEEENEGIV